MATQNVMQCSLANCFGKIDDREELEIENDKWSRHSNTLSMVIVFMSLHVHWEIHPMVKNIESTPIPFKQLTPIKQPAQQKLGLIAFAEQYNKLLN